MLNETLKSLHRAEKTEVLSEDLLQVSPGIGGLLVCSNARVSGRLSGDILLRVCLGVSLQVEKRLDLVKQVTHSTHKKLTACLQGQQGADTEKRSVKSPSVSTRVHLSPSW